MIRTRTGTERELYTGGWNAISDLRSAPSPLVWVDCNARGMMGRRKEVTGNQLGYLSVITLIEYAVSDRLRSGVQKNKSECLSKVVL